MNEPSLFEDFIPPTTTDDFNQFWKAYPRKDAKKDAQKAWRQVKPDLGKVLTALAWQTQSHQWTKDAGRYVPLPASYLRGERWNDEAPRQRRVVSQYVPQSSDEAERIAETARRIQERKDRELEERRAEFLRKHPDGRLR